MRVHNETITVTDIYSGKDYSFNLSAVEDLVKWEQERDGDFVYYISFHRYTDNKDCVFISEQEYKELKHFFDTNKYMFEIEADTGYRYTKGKYSSIRIENDMVSLTAVDGKECCFITSDIDKLVKFNDYISGKSDYYVMYTNYYSQTVKITKEQYTELKEYLTDNPDMLNWGRKDSYRPKRED